MRSLLPSLFLSAAIGLAADAPAHAFDAPPVPAAAPGVVVAQFGGSPDGGYGGGGGGGGGSGGGGGGGEGGLGRRQRGGYGPPMLMRPGFQGLTHAPSGPYVDYRGYRIDIVDAGENSDVSGAVAGAEHQIDIVDGAGLGSGTLAFFRSLPIRVMNRPGGAGTFNGGDEVEIGSGATNDDRPILLHEYLHAYEWHRMADGFRNPEIWHFYKEALDNGMFPRESYMMTDASEYFAVTASCFLHGTVAREPFTRAAIEQRQPDYYAYLTRLFGTAG